MIDGFAQDVKLKEKEKGSHETTGPIGGMKDFPEIWKMIMGVMQEEPKTIPQIASELDLEAELITWHMMTMNKYYLLESAGNDESDEYYLYQLKNKVQ